MNRNTKANSGENANNTKSDQSASSAGGQLTSNIAVATNDSIKIIAESIGISNLSEEACRDLASDLTFIVKSILNVNYF